MLIKTVGAFFMKAMAALAGFLLNIILARQLGAGGTGLYYLSLSCISIATMVSQFGLGQSLLRFIAVSASQGDWPSVQGVVRKGRILCLTISFLVSLVVFMASPAIARYIFHNDVLEGLLRTMTLAIIPGALFVLNGYSLQALSKIKSSIFLTGISVPFFSSIMMFFMIPRYGIKGSVISFVIATWLTMLLSGYLWQTFTPQLREIKGNWELSALLKSNIPLFWVSLSQLVMAWSSSVMLGIWATEADVGLFSIANKIALLISFILASVNTVIAPQFAALYPEDNIEKLQQIVIKATILMAATAAPVALIMTTFPEAIMSLFGDQFVEAAPILVILSLGQFVYVVTGATGYLLTMSGHEAIMRNIMVFCSIVLLLLNISLIPRFGVYGAAVATTITMIVQNLTIAVAVWKRVGVVGIPFMDVVIPRSRKDSRFF